MRLDYETLNRKIVVQQENPRRRDSEAWTRYEGYKSATTLQGFLDAGGLRTDITNDFKRGFLAFYEEDDGRQLKRFVPSADGAAARRVFDTTNLIEIALGACELRAVLSLHAVCRATEAAAWPSTLVAHNLVLNACGADAIVAAMHVRGPETTRTIRLAAAPPAVVEALRSRAHRPVLVAAAAVTPRARHDTETRRVETNGRRLANAGAVRPVLQFMSSSCEDQLCRHAASRVLLALCNIGYEESLINLVHSGVALHVIRALGMRSASAESLVKSLARVICRLQHASGDSKGARAKDMLSQDFESADGPRVLIELLSRDDCGDAHPYAIFMLTRYFKHEPQSKTSEVVQYFDKTTIGVLVSQAKPVLELANPHLRSSTEDTAVIARELLKCVSRDPAHSQTISVWRGSDGDAILTWQAADAILADDVDDDDIDEDLFYQASCGFASNQILKI